MTTTSEAEKCVWKFSDRVKLYETGCEGEFKSLPYYVRGIAVCPICNREVKIKKEERG